MGTPERTAARTRTGGGVTCTRAVTIGTPLRTAACTRDGGGSVTRTRAVTTGTPLRTAARTRVGGGSVTRTLATITGTPERTAARTRLGGGSVTRTRALTTGTPDRTAARTRRGAAASTTPKMRTQTCVSPGGERPVAPSAAIVGRPEVRLRAVAERVVRVRRPLHADRRAVVAPQLERRARGLPAWHHVWPGGGRRIGLGLGEPPLDAAADVVDLAQPRAAAALDQRQRRVDPDGARPDAITPDAERVLDGAGEFVPDARGHHRDARAHGSPYACLWRQRDADAGGDYRHARADCGAYAGRWR